MRKVQSMGERMIRAHKREIRKLKAWCEKNQRQWFDFETAPHNSICTLSTNEYEIGTERSILEEDHLSIFLLEEDYDDYTVYNPIN